MRHSNRGPSANTLRRMTVIFYILGSLTFFFTALPSMAATAPAPNYSGTYTANVGTGTNGAHSGVWTFTVSYDSATQTVSFTVLTPQPIFPYIQTSQSLVKTVGITGHGQSLPHLTACRNVQWGKWNANSTGRTGSNQWSSTCCERCADFCRYQFGYDNWGVDNW